MNDNNQENSNANNEIEQNEILDENKENQSLQLSRSAQYSISQYGYGSQKRIKPGFYRAMKEVFNNNINEILDFLDLYDLCYMRALNRNFLFIIHEYYKQRLKFEINLITNFQDQNKEKTAIYMKNIDSQIPISTKNWLDFDLISVTQKLKILDRNILTKLRAIKSIGKLSDVIYAPFCIIFGYNKNANSFTKNDTWKKTAGKILSDSNLIIKITNLDLENMIDSEILEAFVFLNLPECDVDIIKKFSSDFAKLIIWCQAVVSYHILIHPYTFRNENSAITLGNEVCDFAKTMNYLINRFYKFKRLLYNLNVIKIPLADYVFNLQHNREIPQEKENYIYYLNEENIGNILSYLPYLDSYKFMNVSKKFFAGFKCGIDLIIGDILKEIYFFKLQSYIKSSKRIPIIYSNNIFSKYFLMLEDILDSKCNENGQTFIPFMTKEQINDLKNIKINNRITNTIAKIFCIICDIKPKKKIDLKGDVQILYLSQIRLLATNGSLLKIMRNLNKLYFNQNKVKTINNELEPFLSVERLDEVKKINHGLYQLLIWEIYILEYLRIFNIFDFCNVDYIKNRFEKDEIELIKYYIQLMDYLKYNLKIKYYFSQRNKNTNPSFEFAKLVEQLKNYLIRQNMTDRADLIFETTNLSQAKIGSVYFESKDLIPNSAKPALYERIMTEIISCQEKDDIEFLSLEDEQTDNFNQPITEKDNDKNINLQGNNNINTNNTNNNNNNINNINLLNSQSSSHKILKSIRNPISVNSNPMFNNNTEDKINFLNMDNELYIKNILFYLDINSLPKFALICHKANDCVKTHIFIRLYFLNREKRMIEQESSEIIQQIDFKRQLYYNEYEIQIPNKLHAFSLMNQITSDDIMELKQCFKKYNKTYENMIKPLLLLLGEKPKSIIQPDGNKLISYFDTAKKVLYQKNFIKRIRDLELETIPVEKFQLVDKSLQNNIFSPERLKQLSPCFNHLINWLMGVMEFHRVIRKFSLNSFDFDILDNEEQRFCDEMDNIILLYYKLLRYATKHCKRYEKYAQEIMSEMNIPFN